MKNILVNILAAGIMLILHSCIFVVPDKNKEVSDTLVSVDSSKAKIEPKDSLKKPDSLVMIIDTVHDKAALVPGSKVDTKNVLPQQVVDFAKTLIGIPYRYASTDPAVGFDCSGFITYVFKHFNIVVPRSSIDFTHVGKDIPVENTKPGDLILFTGTDSTEKFVGHMGLIVSNDKGQLSFIHSTSGKKYGVTITELNGYYKGRYMKSIRIFPQNEM